MEGQDEAFVFETILVPNARDAIALLKVLLEPSFHGENCKCRHADILSSKTNGNPRSVAGYGG